MFFTSDSDIKMNFSLWKVIKNFAAIGIIVFFGYIFILMSAGQIAVCFFGGSAKQTAYICIMMLTVFLLAVAIDFHSKYRWFKYIFSFLFTLCCMAMFHPDGANFIDNPSNLTILLNLALIILFPVLIMIIRILINKIRINRLSAKIQARYQLEQNQKFSEK